MRQVPQYLIIGNGRVARHFCHYFTSVGLNYFHWHRVLPLVLLHDWKKQATHILLAISDGGIESFIDEYLKDTAALKVHFSGSLASAKAFGAHPLMTFGPDLYPAEQYPAIPFFVDETAPAFDKLLPGLSNPHFRLPVRLKAKYHALCVMAGNFNCILWQNLFTFLENDLGAAPQAAQMFLQQQADNLKNDYRRALTGPLVRGDTATLERNIAALSGDPYRQVYEAFITAWQEKNQERKKHNDEHI